MDVKFVTDGTAAGAGQPPVLYWMCGSTTLVIFRTVVLAMDRFAGHIWNISHWTLFAILVTEFFGLAIFLKAVFAENLLILY